MNYKISQFNLTPSQHSQSTLEIYVAQPDANKEALAGKLFALMEIETNKAAGLKIINFLINSLNHNYYQNEKMILRERVNTIKIEHIFESALAKTNKKLAEFLQTEKIKFNLDILNLTIGVIYNDSLHFANLGKNKCWLIYRSKDDSKYKLADITEQTSSPEAKKSPSALKLFSNIISGALPRGGYFIFSSEALGEYLSAKQIVSIVTTLPPAGAAEQIKNTLGQINSYVPFLGLIIKNAAGLDTLDIKIQKPAASTESSINNLIVTEEKTEKLLTPSGLISGKKWASFFNILTGRLSPKPADSIGRPALLLKDKIFTKRKENWPSPKKIFRTLINLGAYLIGLFVYIFKIITDKKALIDFFTAFIFKIKKSWLALKASALKLSFWYKNLNRINKILLSVFLACGLILAASLGWQSLKNKNLEKQTIISNLTAAIEQKQNQIDASLLYNNESGAAKVLLEVKELLKQLPQNSQNQKDIYREFAAKHQVQMEKISRVIRVTPVELANFVNFNPSAKPTNIILAKGKIYAADASPSTVYSIELASKLVTSINLNNQSGRLSFPSLDKNGGNIYYLSSNRVSVLDTKSDKLSGLEINYSGQLEKISAFKQYNNRFYLTDPAAGQIYRFTKNGDRLSGATPWLYAPADLKNVVGMDIDGDVYLLRNNGEISKYGKGKKQDLNVMPVEPALTEPTKIIASAEQNYFYVLEPLNKRLVVFDKAGKFINQYTGDKFDNLKDFQIDEKNNKIYLLNGAVVYSVDLINTK